MKTHSLPQALAFYLASRRQLGFTLKLAGGGSWVISARICAGSDIGDP